MTSPPVPVVTGPKIVLMGAAGTGKTHAIGTLCDWAAGNGFEVAILFAGNEAEVLLGYYRDRGLEPPPCVFWHQQLVRPISMQDMIDNSEKIASLTYESLTKVTDGNRRNNNAMRDILSFLNSFIDDRTGKNLGPIDAFPVTRILVIDPLTEVANAFMKAMIGSRPTAAPPDYGVSQNNFMNFLRYLTQGIVCPVVINAHVNREFNELTQSTTISIKSIGKALATDIPPLFSEVILTVREGDKFYWDTLQFGVDSKTRSLGHKSKMDPNFKTVMDKWVTRNLRVPAAKAP